MKIFHDSHSTEYRMPFGAAETSSEVRISIDITECELRRVMFGMWKDEEGRDSWQEMEKTSDGRYSVTVRMPDAGTLIWYAFAVTIGGEGGDRTVYYGNNTERLGGSGCIYDAGPVPYQITVYKKAAVPDWYKDGIIYQIFPGRFARQ